MFGTLRRHWFFISVQFTAIGCVAYWWRHLPVPGYAIGVLAVLAAVMSVHGDMRPWQKVIWMLLIGAFLFLEFRAIDKDRADYSRAEKERRSEELTQFAETMRQFSSQTEREENLRVLVGENSYQGLVREHTQLRAEIATLNTEINIYSSQHDNKVQIIAMNSPSPQVDRLREQKRYEDQVATKIDPQMFALFERVLLETDKQKVNRAELVQRYNVTANPDSVIFALRILQTYAAQLVP